MLHLTFLAKKRKRDEKNKSAFNRRYYEDVVQGFEGSFGVAIMDLDDFKIYNDSCGHQAGDLALEVTAAVIRDCIRQTDTLIRYGGDEFLLILPGCPIEKIRSKLEQIRARVQTTSVPGYPHIHLSLSSGVWYGWCRPRPASRSTTPPCWSMC